MSRYINSYSGQLFDPGDVLESVSETAQDLERLYNRWSGDDEDAMPASFVPDSDTSSGSGVVMEQASGEEGTQEKPMTLTDYLPYAAGVAVALVIIWWVVKK